MGKDAETNLDTGKGRLRSVIIMHGREGFTPQVVLPWLASFSELVGIVRIEESRKAKLRRIRNEYKRSGALGLADVLAMRLAYKAVLARQDKRWLKECIVAARERFGPVPDVPEITVSTPNSKESQKFLEELAPDFVLARCKFILKKRIFTIPRCGTFVIHPGITPEYRNSHGCFWAMVRGDFNKIGATLLRIDEGIDTGPVLAHYHYQLRSPVESHFRIQDQVVWDNLDSIAKRITDYCTGKDVSTVDVSGRDSMVWGQPRLTLWGRFALHRLLTRNGK